jgi:rhodanese-related sulfurtransferase
MMAIDKGFTQVYDLIGGTTNWTAAGFPVVY